MSRTHRPPLSPDSRRVVAAQALRAFIYGFGALLLGTTLKERGLSSTEVGVVLACVVAGTIVMSVAVASWSDRIGRRRFYIGLYVVLAAAGAVYALTANVVVLAVVALTGVLSTDIVDNGPFTSLEQAILATDLARRERIRGSGCPTRSQPPPDRSARSPRRPQLTCATCGVRLPRISGTS